GTRAFGDSFTEAMTKEAQRRGAPSYRFVNNLTVRPSEDIGRLASEHVRRGRFRGDPIVVKRVFTLLDFGIGDEADLASYLLFDGAFCKQLIEMGRADAKARRDELLDFFGDKSDDGGSPLEGEDPSGSWDSRSMPVP